ncbi:hypothetical protein C0J52_20973 [Blattella germanica]|nr:hypothetical protein C0J52_20973 [Blattella germanica]
MDLKNRDILCLWIFLSTKSTVHSPTYVGAVVEYSPRIPDETNQHSLLTLNVEKYSHFIMEAAAKDVDIIVFPEYELSSYGLPWRKMFNNPDFLTHIPDPQEQINPCVNESVNVSQAFRNISCSARHHKIYVVVVAIERTPCDNEATCSLSQKFATSVAFNREGTVIGKYRDSNLFGEPLFTKPYPQEISTFDTDFGVKFGMISGMDIVSHIPTRELINRKILDFVYPHFWRNELPFYTGIQVQAAWSRAQNVNLLAAAHNNPAIGCGGSGIHSGRKGTRTVYKSLASSKSYVAAVVEHTAFASDAKNSSSMLNKIIENYPNYMKEAAEKSKKCKTMYFRHIMKNRSINLKIKVHPVPYMEIVKDADIIVFPGCSMRSLHIDRYESLSRELTTLIPEPDLIYNPCTDTDLNVSEVLRAFSCGARNNNIYVVTPLLEIVPCNESKHVNTCAPDAVLYFATVVAFDRKGTIVGKYQGSHLIGEPLLTRSLPPKISSFDTDFGVKFGLISGVGILFPEPALRLVNEFNIVDIAYVSFWTSELPFLSGISGTRASSIKTNSSTLLVGSLDKIDRTCSETDTCPSQKYEHESYLSALPIQKGLAIQREQMKVYKTISLSKYFEYKGNIGTVERNFTTCHESLCCDFQIKMKTEVIPIKHGDSKPIGYYYRIAVFDGVRTLRGVTTIGINVCAILACSGTRLSTCGQPVDFTKPYTMKTVFEKLVIKGRFRSKHSSQVPSILDDHLRIFPVRWFKFKKQMIPKTNTVKITMQTTVKNASLFAFGIYGRDFERDGTPATTEEFPED